MDNENALKVRKIEAGTVIDHIPAGKGLDIVDLLALNGEYTYALLSKVVSSKYGFKDLLKIEGVWLDDAQVKSISEIAPNATIGLVKDFQVVEKYRVKT